MKRFFKKILNGLDFLYFDGLSNKEKKQKVGVLLTIVVLSTIILGRLLDAYFLIGFICSTAGLLAGLHSKNTYPDNTAAIQYYKKKQCTGIPRGNGGPY